MSCFVFLCLKSKVVENSSLEYLQPQLTKYVFWHPADSDCAWIMACDDDSMGWFEPQRQMGIKKRLFTYQSYLNEIGLAFFLYSTGITNMFEGRVNVWYTSYYFGIHLKFFDKNSNAVVTFKGHTCFFPIILHVIVFCAPHVMHKCEYMHMFVCEKSPTCRSQFNACLRKKMKTCPIGMCQVAQAKAIHTVHMHTDILKQINDDERRKNSSQKLFQSKTMGLIFSLKSSKEWIIL